MNAVSRRVARAPVAALLGALLSSVGADAAGADPLKLYGREILFSVHREGTEVGFHRTRFAPAGDDLVVDSRFELAIRVLFVTAYRYSYRSRAHWRDGRLLRLLAEVDDDGSESRLAAARDGEAMVIETSGARERVAAPLYPTNHWNAAVLGQGRVLNTLTGTVNNVSITPLEETSIETERGPVSARRHRYTGDLEVDVWYDAAGRWVAMRFEGRDGSMIEYRCKICQGPPAGDVK